MSHQTLISEIKDWLVDEALLDPDVTELFAALCERLRSIGVPIDRASLTWPVLHPLFRAEQIFWRCGEGATLYQYDHASENNLAWVTSPFYQINRNGAPRLRRRLTGEDALLDFSVLPELAAQGFTDYLVTSTPFKIADVAEFQGGKTGIMASWATKRELGFTAADLEALVAIQRHFALACHASIQHRVMANIAGAYLGATAGWRAMAGEIRRGDGDRIQAVVWYSDLRDSTRLSNAMEAQDYLDLLNCYYDCTAQPVIEEGGEILEFIGDAVLAIFPIKGETGGPEAVRAAHRAMEKALDNRAEKVAEREAAGLQADIRFSIAITAGEVMFGNIGVPSRLTFSAIGPAVNEVSRIDALSKTLGRSVLTTAEIARIHPELWDSLGPQHLRDFDKPIELFARICRRDAFDDAASGPVLSAGKAAAG